MTEEGLKMASQGKNNDNGLPVFGKKKEMPIPEHSKESIKMSKQRELSWLLPYLQV